MSQGPIYMFQDPEDGTAVLLGSLQFPGAPQSAAVTIHCTEDPIEAEAWRQALARNEPPTIEYLGALPEDRTDPDLPEWLRLPTTDTEPAPTPDD